MRYEVPMPSLGADMDQGKLMRWMIKPGDQVRKGQAIAVVETTKSSVEIESFRDGKVLELIGKEGDEILVGGTIAAFEIEGEKAPPIVEAQRIKVSPAARRLAHERGIDLKSIHGSGAEGQIELKDLELPVAPSTAINLREAIAKAMSRSKKEIPHYYLRTRVSLDHFMQWIDGKNQVLSAQERLLIPAVLMRAIVLALRENPDMNGYFEKGKFTASTSINLGTAVSLKAGGVLVPAILNAESLNLHELNTSLQDLVLRARRGELKNRELTEGTMTITNVGERGSHEVFGIIFPPQVAIVGLGRIREEAVVDQSRIRPGFVMDVTLSADHRVTDGLSGMRFLASIEKYLNEPNLLEDTNERSGNKNSTQRDLPANRTRSFL